MTVVRSTETPHTHLQCADINLSKFPHMGPTMCGCDTSTLNIASYEPGSYGAWPGRIADVITMQGCEWRCTNCQFSAYLDIQQHGSMCWIDILEKCTDVSHPGAVVFTGGEPTRQLKLGSAIEQLKNRGISIGIHTNGMYPQRITALAPMLDWVRVDIKAPDRKHRAITQRPTTNAAPYDTIERLLAHGVSVQAHTTFDPLALDEDDLLEIGMQLTELGVGDYLVQRAQEHGTSHEYTQALRQYRFKSAHTSRDILPLSE